jgi:hypothetical protein|tara:strand:+ start:358 stop:507 length:150 start_codon:yes stop_codon:yes gene_type:complete
MASAMSQDVIARAAVRANPVAAAGSRRGAAARSNGGVKSSPATKRAVVR